MKKLLVPSLLGLAALAVAYAATYTGLARRANVRVPDAFPHVYVQSELGSALDCLVSDRAGVTTRRSEPDLVGARWKCTWIGGEPGHGVLAALTGKSPAQLFVPFGEVSDPGLPLLYGAVREVEDGLLPRVRWVELFWNRQYAGLYLQLRLPGKRYAVKRELARVEVLSLDADGRVHCWNRKLRPRCALYDFLVAEGVFPEPVGTPGLRWLAALQPPDATRAFLLADVSEDVLGDEELWPMAWPWAPERLLDTPETAYVDRRFASWRLGRSEPPGDVLDALAPLDADVLAARLADSIRATCRVTGCDVDAALEAVDASVSLAWLRQRHRLGGAS